MEGDVSVNDPLYDMETTDEFWWPTFAEEVSDLLSAVYQHDVDRRERKMWELHHAMHRLEGNEQAPE